MESGFWVTFFCRFDYSSWSCFFLSSLLLLLLLEEMPFIYSFMMFEYKLLRIFLFSFLSAFSLFFYSRICWHCS